MRVCVKWIPAEDKSWISTKAWLVKQKDWTHWKWLKCKLWGEISQELFETLVCLSEETSSSALLKTGSSKQRVSGRKKKQQQTRAFWLFSVKQLAPVSGLTTVFSLRQTSAPSLCWVNKCFEKLLRSPFQSWGLYCTYSNKRLSSH